MRHHLSSNRSSSLAPEEFRSLPDWQQLRDAVPAFSEDHTRPARPHRLASTMPNLVSPQARRENGAALRTPVLDGQRERVRRRHELRQVLDLDTETGELNPRVWDATRSIAAVLDKDAKSASAFAPAASGGDERRRMYAMQDTAARLLSDSRVCHCNRTRVSSTVDLRVSPDGRAYYGGLQTCGSVWACPICAARVTTVRRDELQSALEMARAGGLHVSMLTLTAPHGPRDDLGELQQAHRVAYRRFASGRRALKTLLESVGYVGTIRGQEVTHGANGWHPHWHVLIFTALPLTDLHEAAVLSSWQAAAAYAGLGEVSRSALRLDRSLRLSGDEAVGKLGLYVVKWGASEELTRSHVKKAGRGGRSPWQLLSDATDGDTRAGALWHEYARCYKGQRQLVWSQGLRDLFGLREPLSDEEAAALEPEGHSVAVVMTKAEWALVRSLALRWDLLDVALTGAGPLCLAPGRRAGLAARAYLDQLDGVRCLAPGSRPCQG